VRKKHRGDKMSARPAKEKVWGDDSQGPEETPQLSDPIARNLKDEQAQVAEVRRMNERPSRVAPGALMAGRHGESGPQLSQAPSATDLLISILRFKWTILLVGIFVSGPMIAFIWTQMLPKYQAKAEVRVRPIIPRLVFRDESNGMIPLYDSFVNTQVSYIRGVTVLQRVLDQNDIQATAWYKNPPKSLVQRLTGSVLPPMERLRNTLIARPRPKTEIIDVSFEDVRAADARLIVDTVLNQYMKYIGEKSNATEDALYNQLVEQYRSLEIEIQVREGTCADIRRRLGTDTPQEFISARRVRLDETQARLKEVQNTIALLEGDIVRGAVVDGNGVVSEPNVVAERQRRYHEDAEWRKLELNVEMLQHQIANSIYSSKHPNQVRLDADLKFAIELRQSRETQLDEQWRDQMTAVAGIGTGGTGVTTSRTDGGGTAKYQLARAKQEEQLLRAELASQQTEFKSLFEDAQLLEKETAALQNKQGLFDEVRQRLDVKRTERNVPGSIEVMAPAFSPSEPQEDRRVVFTAMALCLGLGMGGGLAFLRASRDQAVYAMKDMPHSVQVLFLGHVPLVRAKRSPGRLLCEKAADDRLPLIESVRVMRTALLARLNGEQGTSVLVTSAAPGTGKSSFTMLLGESLAQAGRRVLAIDADFHKMTLSKWFDLADKPGFLDALASKSVGMRCISPTETPGLYLMPAGKRGDGQVIFEETANGAFKACMEQLTQQYNIILLDGSPILPVADAVILAGQVDGAIMVEREHISRRVDVADALARLGSAGGRLLGTVFVGSGSREGYGYHYNYGYHCQQATKHNAEK
jgi:capsular exopolysaccharide synthesis family protein